MIMERSIYVPILCICDPLCVQELQQDIFVLLQSVCARVVARHLCIVTECVCKSCSKTSLYCYRVCVQELQQDIFVLLQSVCTRVVARHLCVVTECVCKSCSKTSLYCYRVCVQEL